MKPIDRLLEIMAKLRSPEGCPWDKEQNNQSIKAQLIEECYELVEAIEDDDNTLMKEELGDVLLHVVFHCQLGREEGVFDFDSVAQGICDKLVRRHPHVFGSETLGSSEEVLVAWQELKKKEKPERDSVLSGVPRPLPGLMRAQEIQKKAARVGFDWSSPEPVLEKVREELEEVEEAISKKEGVEEEIGDLFFAAVNLARHHGIDAESACRQAVDKFEKRFRWVERGYQERGAKMEESSLEELDVHWEEAKKNSR
jgi:tetrapyrrole methylase family protein/MazG family protein